MEKSLFALLLLGMLCSLAPAQDVDLDGVIGPEDLFVLSQSWDVFFDEDRSMDFLNHWKSGIDYSPEDESVVLELTQEGNEPQIYVDQRGIAYTIYVKRTPERAPDNSIVMTSQLAYASILPSGQYWMNEQILTERKPDIYIFGEYYGPILCDLDLVGSESKQGDFFAIWKHYSSGFSMIRFNAYGIPITKEYVADNRHLDDIDRFDAVMDLDGNIHITWTECPYCFAAPEIRGNTREIRYSKFTPEGDMLIDPPVTLGTRFAASGNAELFRPVIRRLPSTGNFLVLIDQGESNPAIAVRVDGSDGSILQTKTLAENYVEPDYIEMDNGDIALTAMIFVLSSGRDVFFTVLNPDLTEKVAPVNLSKTIQQSDGAAIAVVEDDFYVAWNENSDNYMRLVRLNANGSRQGSLKKLNGPGIGFPYRLRLVSDFSGLAHIVYADGKGSIPAKVSYEKLKID